MSHSANSSNAWDIQASRTLYNIDRWGAKYFDINDEGHVVARPLQEKGCAVDLTDVAEEARARGLKFPLLVRFQDILRHRVDALNQAFRNSISEYSYQGKYRGVFPIKVNQLREVVEEILEAGKQYNFGLEVGISGVPESFLVDSKGMIVKTMRGPIGDAQTAQHFIDAWKAEGGKVGGAPVPTPAPAAP